MRSSGFPFEKDELEIWSRLIRQIYDCALDEKGWPATIHSIMTTVGATGAQFVTLLGSRHETLSDLMIGLDANRALREFEELISSGQQKRVNWAAQNPGMKLLYDYQHASEAEMAASLFYQEHARPLGVDYYAAIVCRPRPDHMTGLVLFREKSLGHFSPEQLRFFDSLSPHVERTLLLSHAIGRANVLAGVESVLAAVPVGAVAIDRQLHVVGINTKAEAASQDALGFTVSGSNIRNSSKEVIQGVLEQVRPRRGRSISHGPRERRLIVERRSGLSPYQFVFTHITPTYASLREGLCVILIIDPEEKIEVPLAVISEAFGLTLTESSIVARLVAGRTIAEIAAMRHCKVDTVRSHVKNALNKTGCHRQSELVALVLRHSIV